MSAPLEEVAALRARFRFDVARLRAAAVRVDEVDRQLKQAREGLRSRSGRLAKLALDLRYPELEGSERVQVLYAKAQAASVLARRAGLRDVLSTAVDGLALVSSMATSRWVASLQGLSRHPHGETLVRPHIEAGRVAYRVLRSVRRSLEHVEGLGQLTSTLVVAEFVHLKDDDYVAIHLLDGLKRARKNAQSHQSDEVLFGYVSEALREATNLLEAVADRSEPLTRVLVGEADELEAHVEARLRAR